MKLRPSLAIAPLLMALGACLSFPPGDICGYQGFCGDAGASDGDAFDAPEGCDLGADPKDSPACVVDSVAVFVAPTGKPTASGSMADPVDSLTTALTKVGSKPRIYICEGNYSDSPTIKSSVAVFGGLKCDWKPANSRPVISGAKSDYVVKVEGVSGKVTLVDLDLRAKAAVVNGESSIGMFVSNSTGVSIRRLAINASTALPGKAGTLTNYDFSAFTAQALKGFDAINNTGGTPNQKMCPNNATTRGGAGGDTGLDGEAGQPMATGGSKGIAGPNMISACTQGGLGSPGSNGQHGKGGIQGTLSLVGWAGGDGEAGKAGEPGGGGGGGGGQVSGGNSGGGGGGGAGGCGGAGGTGGQGGGSSIAIISIASTISITQSTLTAANAGDGGNGVAGQGGLSIGGIGGAKGKGALLGCDGGNGGRGGDGGSGGGGGGGLSVAIFYKGTKPTVSMDTMLKFGTKGNPGTSPAGGASNGADGIAVDMFECSMPNCL